MNELIHLRQGEQKLRPIIKFKTYNRGLFEIYKSGSYLMKGVLLIIIIIKNWTRYIGFLAFWLA